MKITLTRTTAIGCAVATTLYMTAVLAVTGTAQVSERTPLAMGSSRITITGTSNIHAYSATTTHVRVTRALGAVPAGPEFWDALQRPGAIDAFEIAVAAATLASPKDGLDKNMHRALKVHEHADITFRLLRLEPAAVGVLKAVGMLRIAGVEREIAMDLKTVRQESGLAVKGDVQIVMTDYGIKPPTARLGMLKTDPKVTVSFETLIVVPLT